MARSAGEGAICGSLFSTPGTRDRRPKSVPDGQNVAHENDGDTGEDDEAHHPAEERVGGEGDEDEGKAELRLHGT